jgi:hypothetical protein
MSRSRASRLLCWAAVLAAACVDGSGPTESGRAIPLDIRPRFQVDPSLFPAAPVDRIRLVARDASTSELLGRMDLEVSPTAEQWTISLGITLGGAERRSVTVDVELLGDDAVQWSGRLGPITVQAGTTSSTHNVEIHRGPLDNLDVIALELADPPATISVGSTVLLVANPTLASGSTAVPTVYWASTTPSVATVAPTGLVTTVTGVAPGRTQIIAVAGNAHVELDLEVTLADAPPTGGKTWVGGTVGAANDWHTAGNWSPPGVPGPSDHVVIPIGLPVLLSQDAAAANAFVYGSWTVPVDFTATLDGTLALFPGATLQVDGAVTAAGGCVNYGGQILGDGDHPCPPPPAVDYTWVGGDIEHPTAWGNQGNWQPQGLPGPNAVVYVPSTTYEPVLLTDAAVGGLFVGYGSIDLNGNALTVAGDVVVDGGVSNGLLEVGGAGAELRGTVPDLHLAGPRSLTGYLHVSGNLTLSEKLTVGSHYVDVLGDLSVESAQGALVMTEPGSHAYVAGNTTFDGASHSGSLTGGVLQVLGDFTVGATHDEVAFRSDGALVALIGDADQTITFANPAPGLQAFHDLYVVKSGGALLLRTDVVVEGVYYSSGSRLARAVGASTALLQLHGGAQIYETTFDGLPLRISTALPPSQIVLSFVTFTNMPSAETQLRVAVASDGISPLQLQSPVFDTPPGPNAYYLHVVNTTQQGALLEVHVTNPTPPDQPGQVLLEGLTEIFWPYAP